MNRPHTCGEAALKRLRNAASKGYQDVAHLKKDTELDPLRSREAFQKLQAQLEAKAATKEAESK